MLVLIVKDTEYNDKVPVIVETNLLREYRPEFEIQRGDFPKSWKTAFDAMLSPIVGQVKATKTVILHPLETKTITGFVRKSEVIEAAVTETGDMPTAFSICPRVVSLKNPGKTARVPVRVCNFSAKTIKIESKSVLCNLEEVNVLRSVNLCENSDARNEGVNVYNIQNDEPHRDFGVDIEDSELTEEQKSKV
ncbi:hypothetical protein DPMN_009062 [Dreissena polymorpha]|uniref:Uncharacterized protein n=1 Tax=Dreissena polymorpha TaxID=45954 RepID=A0A9D4RXW3_DREPO|nr:hypothetical protein DPMN_009062 [Dreissena polymorpha]